MLRTGKCRTGWSTSAHAARTSDLVKLNGGYMLTLSRNIDPSGYASMTYYGYPSGTWGNKCSSSGCTGHLVQHYPNTWENWYRQEDDEEYKTAHVWTMSGNIGPGDSGAPVSGSLGSTRSGSRTLYRAIGLATNQEAGGLRGVAHNFDAQTTAWIDRVRASSLFTTGTGLVHIK